MVQQIATDIELIALNWLDKNRIDYQFQSSLMGGFYELGGAVVDILIPDDMIAIRIFGEYWHKGVVKEGRDQIQRENLEAMGYVVVDVWGADLLDPTRVEETMRLAIQGQEVLH